MIIPDRHNKNHSLGQCGAHGRQTSLNCEFVGVSESSLLGSAEGGSNIVSCYSSDIRLGVGVNNAVLDVKSFDRAQSAGGSSVRGDELSDDGEQLGGINSHSLAKEGRVAHAVGVEVTPISITDRRISGSDSAISPGTSSLLSNRARMTAFC